MGQDYDVGLKLLFKYSHGVVAREVFGSPVKKWLNVEHPKVQNTRSDVLAQCADGRLRHVELEVRNRDVTPRRKAEYYLDIYRDYGHVEQVLLYAGPEPLTMPSAFVTPAMRHEFRIVSVRDMDGDLLLASKDWGDNVLALLTTADQWKVHEAVDRQIRRLEGDEQRMAAGISGIISGIIGVDQESERWNRMLELADLKRNKFTGPWMRAELKKERNKERKKSLAREAIGEARGEAKGRAAQVDFVMRTLRARFGRVPKAIEARIGAASGEQLSAIFDRALKAGTLKEVLPE